MPVKTTSQRWLQSTLKNIGFYWVLDIGKYWKTVIRLQSGLAENQISSGSVNAAKIYLKGGIELNISWD